MKLLIASSNKGKIREIRQIMQGYDIISLSDIGIDVDVEETGSTFEENALIKAREICKISGYASVADDSGLCVDYLNGAPGIYTARFAGEEKDDEANIQKLLGLLEGVENRNAKFVSAAAVCFPDGTEIVVRGECEGTITDKKYGDGGFGYDPVFYTVVYNRTFGELTDDEKNAISHRKSAFEKLKTELDKILKK